MMQVPQGQGLPGEAAGQVGLAQEWLKSDSKDLTRLHKVILDVFLTLEKWDIVLGTLYRAQSQKVGSHFLWAVPAEGSCMLWELISHLQLTLHKTLTSDPRLLKELHQLHCNGLTGKSDVPLRWEVSRGNTAGTPEEMLKDLHARSQRCTLQLQLA